jgi:hypothetical protein
MHSREIEEVAMKRLVTAVFALLVALSVPACRIGGQVGPVHAGASAGTK